MCIVYINGWGHICDNISELLDEVGRETIITLWLSGNQLTTLESGVFSGLINLRELSLNSNLLTSLPSGVFNELTNLQTLRLNNNHLSSLESGVFNGLTNLQYLWLDHNQLTSLEIGVFNGLTNLQKLWLNDNQLTPLESGVFSGLTNLQMLWLDYNQLTSLASGVFSRLTKLESLWIGGEYFIRNGNDVCPTISSVINRSAIQRKIHDNGNCIISHEIIGEGDKYRKCSHPSIDHYYLAEAWDAWDPKGVKNCSLCMKKMVEIEYINE